MQKPDSLIFDMDGTLWDAADTYTMSWNILFQRLNINRVMTRDELLQRIGWEGKKVMAAILPEFTEDERIEMYGMVNLIRREIIPIHGGILYNGVIEGLKSLSTKYKLFILSNCGKGIIRDFIDWAGIGDLIIDELAYGVNNMPKHYNLILLMQKHGLVSPVYIGDTAGDSEESNKAGMPFVFVNYGFGTTDMYEMQFSSFSDLSAYFMDLK
jgi:phosphoglycolate phosphatase